MIKSYEKILSNFDSIIQTKSSKIKLEEFITYFKEKSVDQTYMDKFISNHNKEQAEIAEAHKLQNIMLETLNKDIN